MKDLIKKYPNDLELGRAIRKHYLENGDEAAELLKEVLALHGVGGHNYENGLLDEKIQKFLQKIEEL